MQPNASSIKPTPVTCPWCISTNTFTAQRCAICGMDLGQELRAARAVQQPVSTSSAPGNARSTTRRPFWHLAAATLIVLAMGLILGAVVLHGARL